MLLDRIDIDAHGPLNRVELGPFAEHLNVICGPEGSGKTAISRFIRDSLISRDYPLGMMSSSAGRVVWADQHGKVHCRREQDGTKTGRRTIDFESRGDSIHQYGALRHSWIASVGRNNDAMHSAASLSLPESIVDGVITDTAVTSVARVVSACVRSGLDNPNSYGALPIATDADYHDRGVYAGSNLSRDSIDVRDNDHRRRLRSELADVEAELSRLQNSTFDYDALLRRRSELTSQLTVHPVGARAYRHGSRHAFDSRIEALHGQTRGLRARRSELRRWIADLDRESSHRQSQRGSSYTSATYSSTQYEVHAAAIDADLRQRLDDLDAQMIHWRRTLIEVRGLRDAIVAARSHLGGKLDANRSAGPGRSMDQFLQFIDRYDARERGHAADWEQVYNDAYRAEIPLEDIDLRIDSATRQLDWLLDRYAKGDNLYSDWYRADSGYTTAVGYTTAHVASQHPGAHPSYAHSTLADTLAAIREDLNAVQARTSQARVSHAHASQFAGSFPANNRADEVDELTRSERWLTHAITQLISHRDSLLRQQPPRHDTHGDSLSWAEWNRLRCSRERDELAAELRSVDRQLEDCLSEAARVRREMRQLPVLNELYAADSHLNDRLDRDSHFAVDRQAIAAELRRVDEQLASQSRVQWLRARRDELTAQLGAVHHAPSQSPLADAASRWLVRLTAGRLTRVEWPAGAFHPMRATEGHYSQHRANAHLVRDNVVRINGVQEDHVPAADRALVSMAVRMAAGDLLARTGRSIPLVLETHREMLQGVPSYAHSIAHPYADVAGLDPRVAAYRDHSFDGHANHPIAAALHDYVRSGRQVVLLTSSHELSRQIQRVGGRAFNLHAERVVQPHRPLWRPHYQSEKYVGPYAHTYANKLADDFRTIDPHTAAFTSASYGATDYIRSGMDRHVTGNASYRNAAVRPAYRPQPNSSVSDVNRDFDTAWREAYGLYDNPRHSRNHSLPPTEWATDGIDFRDGYYFADAYTTAGSEYQTVGDVVPVPAGAVGNHAGYPLANSQYFGTEQGHATHQGVRQTAIAPIRRPKTPFYLTVDSPIDQAPSVDAVAAARLRGLDVTHVTHLMGQDPNRLSDSLGLANVDADTIRNWQAECRLVCRVPQLRGFDARVLVGCGIHDPAQLAAIHPVDLLQRVEAFLATEMGQRILLSGSSQELSRITTWIAAGNASANASDENYFGSGFAGRTNRNGRQSDIRTVDGRVLRDTDPRYQYDSDRYEYEVDSDQDLSTAGRRRRSSRRRQNRAIGSRQGNGTGIPSNGTNRASYDRSTADRQYVRSNRRYGIAENAGEGFGLPLDADGNGNGNGRGYANGSGNGRGYGSGSGNGNGSGYGEGRGRGTGRGRGNGSGSGRGNGSGSGHGSGTGRSRRGDRNGERNVVRLDREPREYTRTEREPREYKSRERTTRVRSERESRRTERAPRTERASRAERDSERELRFYLDRSSPVVDAPSIGARMAARLEAVGIHTVEDLLTSDPQTVADNLDHRRVDAETILAWQQQATLVCRIPQLRGHDAQLLVAAEVTTPEEVTAYDPNELLGIIVPIAKSSEGKRILRGGKLPDLEEMNEWITNAAQNRELVAA